MRSGRRPRRASARFRQMPPNLPARRRRRERPIPRRGRLRPRCPATLPPATLPDGLSSAEGGTASSVPSAEESGAGSSGAGDSSAWAAGCPSEGTAGAGTSPTAASPTSPDAAQAAARRQGQRERAAQKQRQQGTQNVRPVPPGTCEPENRWSSEPLFPGLDAMDGRSDFALAAGPHACEVLPAIGVYGYWYSAGFAPAFPQASAIRAPARAASDTTISAICRSSIAWLGRMPWSPQHEIRPKRRCARHLREQSATTLRPKKASGRSAPHCARLRLNERRVEWRNPRKGASPTNAAHVRKRSEEQSAGILPARRRRCRAWGFRREGSGGFHLRGSR